MKIIIMICAGLLLCAAPALAAELPVSDLTLGDMGLNSMQRMSNDDGLAIRGKGTYAGVWGGSVASYNQASSGTWGKSAGGPSSSSSNFYQAGSEWHGKNAGANGQSLSFAGQAQAQFAGSDLSRLTLNSGLSGGLTNTLSN